MRPDTLGFLYPEVNMELCTKCGLCLKVCSFHSRYDITPNLESPDVYAARHKDIAEMSKSRSGAFFVTLSDKILSRGGVIYGVGYEDHFRVVHKRATNTSQRDEFRKSKYVQSDMNDTLSSIKDDLESGLEVLFTGTPCQTVALRSYLKLKRVDSQNLIICDIACYGVPSPKVWSDYLNLVEQERGKRVLEVDFRNKSRIGWSGHQESFKFSDGMVFSHSFAHIFKKNIILRHSCGVCPFTNFQRPSDITLADFWGWERVNPQFNADNKGVSLVLVNTPKGQKYFEEVSDNITFIPATTEDCIQPSLSRPAIINPLRDELEQNYTKLTTKQLFQRYGDRDIKHKILYSLSDIFKMIKMRIKK